MIANIKNYLQELTLEIRNKLSQDNTIKNKIEHFSIFELINFFLIHKYLLDDKVRRDFFIHIPIKDNESNFLSVILNAILLTKLYQNYFTYKDEKPFLQKEDVVYWKKNIYKVVGLGKEMVKLKTKFPKKNKKDSDEIAVGKGVFTKINPNLSNGRNTSKNIEAYRDFLEQNFGKDFPFLTDFKCRTLVIAEKDIFKETKSLPIRYTSKKGREDNSLPFFSYLVECCNDFESAREFLLNNNEYFDEVIVIGSSKYKEDIFRSVRQEKNNNRYKNIIIIGEEKPNDDFIEWRWSNDEMRIATNKGIIKVPQKEVILDKDLYDILLSLKQEIEAVRNEIDVDLSYLVRYFNFFIKMLFVNSPLSMSIFKNHIDKLQSYLNGEVFQEKIENTFYEKDIYKKDLIREYTNRILNKYNHITELLGNRNKKWETIKQLAENYEKIYLIVDKKHYDAIEKQLKNEKLDRVCLISTKKIDKSKYDLDSFLEKAENNEKALVIVPFLNDTDLYSKLRLVKGDCKVLCYKDIDEIIFDNIQDNFQDKEKNALTHNDRAIFVDTKFEYDKKITPKELSNFFTFKEPKNDDEYDEIRTNLRDKLTYEITFIDGSKDKFVSSKAIFLVEENEQIKTTIGEIYEGATIRFYQNNTPEEFQKVLEILDTEGKLETYDKYAESWKTTLCKLSKVYKEEELYDKLFNGTAPIKFTTFKNYFHKDAVTRFPKRKTLRAIKNFCSSNGYEKELIVIDYENFKIIAKNDRIIRQQAGKILGDDLLEYIASGEEKDSDFLKKIPKNILSRILKTIQEKRINKKQLISSDDE